jgi:hypothetical protein
MPRQLLGAPVRISHPNVTAPSAPEVEAHDVGILGVH